MHKPATLRTAFTLVELLVVIAIIGILVALLLPAIQAARESSRRSKCSNNIRNLALAALNHHDAHKIFPTGGWGWWWVGDPDRGYSRKQPGGWAFNVMPFTEESAAYSSASDGQPDVITTQQLNAMRTIVGNPLPLLHCPTHRAGIPVALTEPGPSGAGSFAWNAAAGTGTPTAGRTDYAINCGDPAKNEVWTGSTSPGTGPSYSSGSVDAVENSFTWCLSQTGKVIGPSGCSTEATGVSFQRSEISIRHITDGTTKTYLIGEKYLCPQNYETGSDDGDDETWCTGYNNDNFRSTILPPQKDRPDYVNAVVFGSAHAGVFQISFCDGHVEGISYDIDPKLHRAYGNRKDGSIAGEIW